jgi:hypothetical protein
VSTLPPLWCFFRDRVMLAMIMWCFQGSCGTTSLGTKTIIYVRFRIVFYGMRGGLRFYTLVFKTMCKWLSNVYGAQYEMLGFWWRPGDTIVLKIRVERGWLLNDTLLATSLHRYNVMERVLLGCSSRCSSRLSQSDRESVGENPRTRVQQEKISCGESLALARSSRKPDGEREPMYKYKENIHKIGEKPTPSG